MKFQIIVESTDKKMSRTPDDDFEKLVRRSLKLTGFKLIGARSLQGMRAEAWQPARREKDALD